MDVEDHNDDTTKLMCVPGKQTTITAATTLREHDTCLINYLISMSFGNDKVLTESVHMYK